MSDFKCFEVLRRATERRGWTGESRPVPGPGKHAPWVCGPTTPPRTFTPGRCPLCRTPTSPRTAATAPSPAPPRWTWAGRCRWAWCWPPSSCSPSSGTCSWSCRWCVTDTCGPPPTTSSSTWPSRTCCWGPPCCRCPPPWRSGSGGLMKTMLLLHVSERVRRQILLLLRFLFDRFSLLRIRRKQLLSYLL